MYQQLHQRRGDNSAMKNNYAIINIRKLAALDIARHQSAHQEVAYELEHRDKYAGKYLRQSTLLLIPLAVPALAVYQELQKRSHP